MQKGYRIMLEWDELISQCSDCTRCELCSKRRNVVIGRGNINSNLMFVGEGPGEQEDIKGLPFVGQAGQLLDLLLNALTIKEEDYYIANIVKCRPPGNRTPLEEEAEKCLPFLRNQVWLIKPKIIVCLGATAMRYIIDKSSKISQIRGQWITKKGVDIMPTFHPAALLRDQSKRSLLWNDMKKVKKRLGEMDCEEK